MYSLLCTCRHGVCYPSNHLSAAILNIAQWVKPFAYFNFLCPFTFVLFPVIIFLFSSFSFLSFISFSFSFLFFRFLFSVNGLVVWRETKQRNLLIVGSFVYSRLENGKRNLRWSDAIWITSFYCKLMEIQGIVNLFSFFLFFLSWISRWLFIKPWMWMLWRLVGINSIERHLE